MKKMFFIGLILVLVWSAFAFAEEDDPLGDWYLVKTVDNLNGSVHVVLDDNTLFKRFTLNADGTGEQYAYVDTLGEGTNQGKWTRKGEEIVYNTTVRNQKKTFVYQYEDGYLINYTNPEYIEMFAREFPEYLDVPVLIPAEKAEDFQGSWVRTMWGSEEGFILDNCLHVESLTIKADEAVLTTTNYDAIVTDGVVSQGKVLTSQEEKYWPSFSNGLLYLKAGKNSLITVFVVGLDEEDGLTVYPYGMLKAMMKTKISGENFFEHFAAQEE